MPLFDTRVIAYADIVCVHYGYAGTAIATRVTPFAFVATTSPYDDMLLMPRRCARYAAARCAISYDAMFYHAMPALPDGGAAEQQAKIRVMRRGAVAGSRGGALGARAYIYVMRHGARFELRLICLRRAYMRDAH